MRQFTSAAAGKYIRSLEDEKALLIRREQETSTYVRALDERDEPPAYNYAEMQRHIDDLDRRIRVVRHAVHLFNATCVLPESNVTIDEALVKLAQMSKKASRLATMREILPKQRIDASYPGRQNAIEYRYANFDVKQVEKDYQTLQEQIHALQLEIDLCNQTKTFEADI